MYIRWLERRHKAEASANIVFQDAYLVESYRNAEGQPRQRVICYLGNLRKIDGTIPLIECELFLHRARHALAQAAAPEQLDIDHVMDLLHQQLPWFSEEDVAELLRMQVTVFCEWWERHGQGCPYEELNRIVHTLQGQEQSLTA